jgi:hypothetical protein
VFANSKKEMSEESCTFQQEWWVVECHTGDPTQTHRDSWRMTKQEAVDECVQFMCNPTSNLGMEHANIVRQIVSGGGECTMTGLGPRARIRKVVVTHRGRLAALCASQAGV